MTDIKQEIPQMLGRESIYMRDRRKDKLYQLKDQAVKIFEEISKISDVPVAHKRAVLESIGVCAFESAKDLKRPTTTPAMPDLKKIGPWVSREESGPASQYLEKYYGHLLKRYNPNLKRDLITLRDLKTHNAVLWQGLYNESKLTGIRPSEYVASSSKRVKERGEDTTMSEVRTYQNLASTHRYAIKKSQKKLEVA